MLLRWIAALLVLGLGPAWADQGTTREAFERLEEILELRFEEGGTLDRNQVLPTLLVQAAPRYQGSETWFGTQALTVLTRLFGPESVRVCEACMVVRTQVAEGRIESQSGPIGLDEIVRLDDRYRGTAALARTAVWLTEIPGGLSMRMIDLRTGRVVFARNVEPDLRSYRGTVRTFTLTQEFERRARGDNLTHALFDMGLFPGQHIALEWADQWGDTNANLSGVVFSLFDPVVGVGAGYHRILEFGHLSVGGKVLVSVPTAVAQAVADTDIEVLDPVLTGVFTVRWPFSDNYALLGSVSTNGRIAVGITFLNTSFIPVLP